MNFLFLQPYYGANISGDMAGDLGIVDYTNQVTPDLSVLYAASLAKHHGVNVRMIDANAERLLPKKVIEQLKGESYDRILIKSTAPTVQLDIRFAKALKRLYPNTPITMGGHIIKILRPWILENEPLIDDPTEMTLEDYVYQLIMGQERDMTIDDLPAPNYDLLPYDRYHYAGKEKTGYIWTSRGCKLSCIYCPYIAYYGRHMEERDLDKVMDDIRYLLDIGMTFIQFRDPYFTANSQRVKELCRRIIASGLKFNWFAETRIDSLDKEMIELMAEAGLKIMGFGVESASLETLKKYKRPTYNLQKAKEMFAYLHEKGVETLGFFLLGFPNETFESARATYQLALDLGLTYSQYNIWTPYPDTPNWSEIEHPPAITPELFMPFENRVTVNPVKTLTRGELEFLAKQFAFMFNEKNHGLEFAYRTHRYHTMLEDRARNHLKHTWPNVVAEFDELEREHEQAQVNAAC